MLTPGLTRVLFGSGFNPGGPPALDAIGGTAPIAAYGVQRLRAAYNGPAIRVVRASDSAVLPIGFVGNRLDEASLANFLTGTTGSVDIFYDQSGNGNDATQTTAASQPTISSAVKIGSSALCFNAQFFTLPAGVATTSRAADAIAVLQLFNSNVGAGMIELGTASHDFLFANTVTNGVGWIRAGFNGANSTYAPQTRTCIFEMELGASAAVGYQNGESTSSTASPVASYTGGFLGHWDVTAGHDGAFYAGAFAIYARDLSASDRALLHAALATQFSFTESPTGRIIVTGDSIAAGSNPPELNWNGWARQCRPMLSQQLNFYNEAAGGSQFSNLLANYAASVGLTLSQYSDLRIVLVACGTNDLTIGGRTAAQILADMQTYCGNVRTSGGKVIVGTVLPNSVWNGTQIATQQTLNSSIRSGWTGFADGLADYAADPVMGLQANAFNGLLYSGGLHPTALGHSYLAPIAAAAFNSLL